METITNIITKVFDFLGKIDYAGAFDKIEAALTKLIEWVASLLA